MAKTAPFKTQAGKKTEHGHTNPAMEKHSAMEVGQAGKGAANYPGHGPGPQEGASGDSPADTGSRGK